MPDYVLGDPPGTGHAKSIGDGIRWVRQELPFQLAHINVWMLDDGDGAAIVDTGVRGKRTRSAWTQLIAEHAPNAAVSRVVATHMHPDHIGSAGWLCENYEAPLWMSRLEYLMARMLIADTGPAPDEGIQFYQRAGLPANAIERYRELFGGFGRACDALPPAFVRIEDGDAIDIGSRSWQVVAGNGHSPEQCVPHR